jgi:hypothetical protein
MHSPRGDTWNRGLEAPDAGAARPRPSCERCGKPIGIYEPAVWTFGTLPLCTSLAASPELAGHVGGGVFHAGCYADPGTASAGEAAR